MKIDKSLIDNNVECTKDKVHRIISALISCTPSVGGALDKAFNATFESPMQVRHQKWMLLVTDAINEIFKETNNTEKDLLLNDAFIDAYMQSSLIAMKHRQDERLDFLKNALINTALTPFNPMGKEQAFLQFIDDFSVWHFKVLFFYINPMQFIRERNYKGEESEGTMHYIKSAFPDLANDDGYLYLIWSDLKNNGLIIGGSPYEIRFVPPTEPRGKITDISGYSTPFGKELMMFVSRDLKLDLDEKISNSIIKPR